VSCHPFPRPVRHRALLRGRERGRGTTGPRLLPQRSVRRAEGSWSGREETAREAPTLSCRTGRGTGKASPPQADLDDGAASATRSVARRALLACPTGRGATASVRPPDSESRSPDTSRRPPPDRSRAPRSCRALGGMSSAMSRAWPGQRPPEGGRPDVVDRSRCPQEPIARERPDAHGLLRLAGEQLEEPQVSGGPPMVLQSLWARAPVVVGLPENVRQKPSGAGRSGTASRRTTGHRPETNWRRSRETAHRNGAEPAAVPGPVHRLPWRRPGTGRCRASAAGR
jgi:hypothetical protein